MELIKPTYTIKYFSPQHVLESIEEAGRTCYKSEDKIADGTAEPFVQRIIKRGHESVLEHESLSVRFVCDRGVTHELVRHRLVAYSQESTRYCDYGGSGVAFIIPPWSDIDPGVYNHEDIGNIDKLEDRYWAYGMLDAESRYVGLREFGWSPQQARSVLPNATKTEIVATTNLREWRHILSLRTSPAAHPQMREIMQPLLADLKHFLPVVFGDIE